MATYKTLQFDDKREVRMIVATSAIDLLSWVEENHEFNRGCASQDDCHRPEKKWDLGAGWNGSNRLIRTGWHEGCEKMVKACEHIKAIETVEPRGYSNDVVGLFFDVGLVNQGEPECWFVDDYQPVRKTVKVNFVGTVSCATSAQAVVNRGGAVAALIDNLQSSGWIVDVSLYWPFIGHREHTGDDGYTCNTTMMKIDLQAKPLDIDEIGYLLAHPAAFRRLGFAVCEAANGSQNMNGYGGGGLNKSESRWKRENWSDKQRNEIINWTMGGNQYDANIDLLEYVTSASEISDFMTERSSAEWLHKQIERLDKIKSES